MVQQRQVGGQEVPGSFRCPTRTDAVWTEGGGYEVDSELNLFPGEQINKKNVISHRQNERNPTKCLAFFTVKSLHT